MNKIKYNEKNFLSFSRFVKFSLTFFLKIKVENKDVLLWQGEFYSGEVEH